MKYLTTYIRRQGEGGSSLLLQEYSCRSVPVCFACLCSCGEKDVDSRHITERLLSWNRRFPWHKAAREPFRWLGRAEKELEEEIRRAAGEGAFSEKAQVKWRLFLCAEQEFLTMGNGFELYLLSALYGRGSAVKLGGSFRGNLEPDAGILLAEEGFLENIKSQALEQIIRAWEMENQTQVSRRLRELDQNGRTAGGKERTAILLIAKEGVYE